MKTPSTEDILNSLGLTRMGPQPTQDWVTPMALFGAGSVAGAAGALLLAPKSGRELRRDIQRTATQVGESVVHALPDTDRLNPFTTRATSSTKIDAIEAK